MKNTIKNIIIICVTVIALILLFLLILIPQKIHMNPAGTIGNTAGNLNNKGLFCEYDGIVYFSNAYDENTLYSMNPDESGMKKLNFSPVEQILAGGSYLFYFQKNSSAKSGLGFVRGVNGVVRSKLDGTASSFLLQEPVFSLQLVDNNLYYQITDRKKGPQFYRKKIDDSETVLLADYVINPSCAKDGIIYYNGTQDDHYLYSLNTASGTSSIVWQGNIWNPIVMGDYVYYMDVAGNYRLCRYSFSEDVIEILTNDRVDYFNIYEDLIYYQKSSASEPALKRMHTDGSEPEVVAEGVFEHINITSHFVYFNEFKNPVPVYRTPVRGTVDVTVFDNAKTAALENH